MSHVTWPLLLVLLLLAPSPVLAQSSAVAAPSPGISVSTPAHPALPWALGPAIPVGQLIRDVWVEPQQVVIDSEVQVPVIPAGEPVGVNQVSTDGSKDKDSDKDQEPATTPATQPAILRQTLTIPGYWVKDTTAGFYIPARWVLVQPSPGTYAWWLAPPEFRRR
jgi:hypothetical protein